MKMGLGCLIVATVTCGCGGIFARHNVFADNTDVPFVPRSLVIHIRDYNTGDPLEGVAVERSITISKRFSLETDRTTIGIDRTPPSGTVMIAIEQPGMVVRLTKYEYQTMAFFPRDRRYADRVHRLTEHDGEIVVPMRLISDLGKGKPQPIHPDWLSDEFKLPRVETPK